MSETVRDEPSPPSLPCPGEGSSSRAFCPRCEDLLREGACRGCCVRCEVLLVDGACPRCPLPAPSADEASLVYGVGELVELRSTTAVARVNAFLGHGWMLLRVADLRQHFLLGWRRAEGAPRYPDWYAAERGERAALLEALEAGDVGFELE